MPQLNLVFFVNEAHMKDNWVVSTVSRLEGENRFLFPYSVTFKVSDLMRAIVLLSRNSEEQGVEAPELNGHCYYFSSSK